jgi:hypothetical protein
MDSGFSYTAFLSRIKVAEHHSAIRHPDSRKYPVPCYCPFRDDDEVKCPVKISCNRINRPCTVHCKAASRTAHLSRNRTKYCERTGTIHEARRRRKENAHAPGDDCDSGVHRNRARHNPACDRRDLPRHRRISHSHGRDCVVDTSHRHRLLAVDAPGTLIRPLRGAPGTYQLDPGNQKINNYIICDFCNFKNIFA